MNEKLLIGYVVKLKDDYTVIINKGSDDGVKHNQEFLIYYEDEEIFDPETKESLGLLEIVCGRGKPTHIQEKMTTLRSCEFLMEINDTKIIRKKNPGLGGFGGFGGEVVTEETTQPKKELRPFKNIRDGEIKYKFKTV